MANVIKALTAEQQEAAFAVRRAVFVDEQQVDRDLEFDEHEKEASHFLATDTNGLPCGAARWRLTDNGVKLERFAVLATHRRQSIGSAMMKAVLQDIAANEDSRNKRIYLHAQIDAIPLYKKFGFSPYGDEFMEADILHQAMERFPSGDAP
ncbi:MAG: GNAT family N-acetyltransferase [Planctomycetales bacterium]|nr:GNAT family N-acetyltransferase [Planctomycetales bacterium]